MQFRGLLLLNKIDCEIRLLIHTLDLLDDGSPDSAAQQPSSQFPLESPKYLVTSKFKVHTQNKQIVAAMVTASVTSPCVAAATLIG